MIAGEMSDDRLKKTSAPSRNNFSLTMILLDPNEFILRGTEFSQCQHAVSTFISTHSDASDRSVSPFLLPVTSSFEQYSVPIRAHIASASMPTPSSLTIISFGPTDMTQDLENPSTELRTSSSTALETEPMTWLPLTAAAA
jgi:hypothetical protein